MLETHFVGGVDTPFTGSGAFGPLSPELTRTPKTSRLRAASCSSWARTCSMEELDLDVDDAFLALTPPAASNPCCDLGHRQPDDSHEWDLWDDVSADIESFGRHHLGHVLATYGTTPYCSPLLGATRSLSTSTSAPDCMSSTRIGGTSSQSG